ncbi:MAG: hypothetical protein IKN17_04245 [Ruminococcus sp.]|nr:hypothetical protein [Ruminococcus sp.]
MSRKWFFLISALLFFSAFGSRSTVASLDRAMVHAVGIDPAEDGFNVTLQIFRPDSAGTETQLDPAKANIFTVSASGKTVSAAMTGCENKLGEFLFIGHVQLIVLGSGIDLASPYELLAPFIRSKESYLGAKLAFTDDSASKLLSAELSEGAVSAQSLVSIIERSAENSVTADCDLLAALSDDTGSLAVPVLKVTDASGDEKEKTVTTDGAWALRDGRREFRLSAEDCSGLALLLCDGAVPEITRQGITVRAKEKTGSLSVSEKERRCRFSISVCIPEDLVTGLLDEGELCRACEQELRPRCERIIALCTKHRTDLLGISKAVRARCPQLWLDCGESFEGLMNVLDVSCGVSCEVR